MYTNIVYILKILKDRLKENPKITRIKLLEIVHAYLPEVFQGTFVGYIKSKKYIVYDKDGVPIIITRKGHRLIRKQKIKPKYLFFSSLKVYFGQ